MLTIKNLDLNRSPYHPYINNIKRLATTTSVKFINNNQLCTTNLVGMYIRLYQFDYNMKTYNLLDHINTTYDGKLCVTDLIDYDGRDLIVTSNFDCGTQTLYKLVNNKLFMHKDMHNFSKIPQFCHGVKFYPYKENIICFTFNRNMIYSIVFVDYVANIILYQFEYLSGYNPKDIAFINANQMIIGYSTSNVTPIITKHNYKSRIAYVQFDLINKSHNVIDHIDINDSHTDCVLYRNNVVFMNDQISDAIVTHHIKNNKLQFIESINLFDKPHGLDISQDNKLLAIANYGDNTVKIIEIPDKTKSIMEL